LPVARTSVAFLIASVHRIVISPPREVLTAPARGRSMPAADCSHGSDAAGAFVVSLDFELHWGVRDIHPPTSGYMASIHGAREAIPRMLDLFVEHGVSATWATVGFLMAESRDELESFHPAVRPAYADRRLDPYAEPIGRDERDDPLHFAPSLVQLIGSAPGQEVGTHTYSHFYCLEQGATVEAFRRDLASALAISGARGLDIRSIVLPRNQWNPAFAPVLRDAGIECYRGTQPGWMYDPIGEAEQTRARRLARLVDAHLHLTPWAGTRWSEVARGAGPRDVRATCFLRPVSGSRRANELRLRRITSGMTRAACEARVFHLWWHPHNFGARTAENLGFLRAVLEHHRTLRSEYGMRSMSMIEASRQATRNPAPEPAGSHV
jgi:peptidoglycan/xylan/chitin deacetylase (PgdA/CDA1 family)